MPGLITLPGDERLDFFIVDREVTSDSTSGEGRTLDFSIVVARTAGP